MPAKPGRYEQDLIRMFVSGYENFAWAGSEIRPLDEEEDGAVEALVTRADGETMAIEHTLIEPFVGEMGDLALFEPAFRRIKDDESLPVPYTAISIYVPVGVLDGQKPSKREVIVEAVRNWIADNRLHLRDGQQKYQCEVPGAVSLTLTVKRSRFNHPRGVISVGRQQVMNDLHLVIAKALRKKLPKLVSTKADRHVLFLERNRFNFFPELMFKEIERQRPDFPLLEEVEEIWHVETVFYTQGGVVGFESWDGARLVPTMAFENGAPIGKIVSIE